MKSNRTQNCQKKRNLEKEEQNWRPHDSWIQNIFQHYGNQSSEVWHEDRHMDRSVGPNREPRITFMTVTTGSATASQATHRGRGILLSRVWKPDSI